MLWAISLSSGRLLQVRNLRVLGVLSAAPHECSEGGYPAWADEIGLRPENRCQLGCDVVLVCLNDYIGGGSHYWSLQCPECWQQYYYDTYSFRLSVRQDFVAYGIDRGLSKLTEFVELAERLDS